jgi:arabinose-5-phosphate isomerase
VGLVTDGDLRRAFMRDGAGLERTAADVMTRSPVTVDRDLRLSEARGLMEARRITSVPVVDADRRVTGIVHIHDLWVTSGR